MLGFFLRFMKQKYGRFICVQLLQTLNILFENISNETSVCKYLQNKPHFFIEEVLRNGWTVGFYISTTMYIFTVSLSSYFMQYEVR